MIETTASRATAGAPAQRSGEARARTARTAPLLPSSPARVQRRPALVGLGVALVALGGLTAGWLVTTTGNTTRVLAVARPVAAGHVIERADLVVVDAHPDPALSTVTASRVDDVVGRRAATGLPAGTLLAPGSTSAQLVPGRGTSLVGVSLAAMQIPAQALVAGDRVRIVDTPPAQADPPATEPHSINGEVVSVGAVDPSGATTVDVLVPDDQAVDLAARAATGRVALVLDSRER